MKKKRRLRNATADEPIVLDDSEFNGIKANLDRIDDDIDRGMSQIVHNSTLTNSPVRGEHLDMATSSKDASKASKLLSGKKSPSNVKSVAGSDLSQTKSKAAGKKK